MKSRAFALPLVLWSIAFLAGLSLLLLRSVGFWLDEQSLAERRFIARQNALTGLAIGMNPVIEPGDPLLLTGNKTRNGHEVRISDESGRINPNYWLKNKDREIFQKLFATWKVDASAQDRAIDGMLDWIDPDDFVQLNGAERGQYDAQGLAGFPPNEPFVSTHEMASVIGLQNLLADHEGWRELFTVWHRGSINVRHASPEVLAAVAGLTPEQAKAFLALRSGKDGIDGTADDKEFASMKDVAEVLNANSAQAQQLENFFSLEGSTRRVDSIGWAEGSSYRISVVLAGSGGSAFLSWEEK